MVSITVSIDEETKARMERFPWVNWSEVGREELLKKDIFEEYIRTGKLSDEDLKFCEKIDWHPVDELPLKEKFIKKLKNIKEGPHSKPMTRKELEKWFEKL